MLHIYIYSLCLHYSDCVLQSLVPPALSLSIPRYLTSPRPNQFSRLKIEGPQPLVRAILVTVATVVMEMPQPHPAGIGDK